VGVVYDMSIVLVPFIGLIIVSLSLLQIFQNFYQRYFLENILYIELYMKKYLNFNHHLIKYEKITLFIQQY
jgi:hypothetical protein